MAEGKVSFELVSPERLLLSEEVDMVVIPGTDGDFGVLPRHSPLISTIRPGVISVREGGVVTSEIFVAGGFAEVTPERCTILAEDAQPVGEINKEVTQQRLKEAQTDLSDAKTPEETTAAGLRVKIEEARLTAAAG